MGYAVAQIFSLCFDRILSYPLLNRPFGTLFWRGDRSMKLRSLFFHAYPAEGSNQRLIRASRRFPGNLHQLAEHFLKLRQRGGPGIAGGAGIRRGGLAEEGQILFLQLFQLRGDAHIDGQLTHRVHRRLAVGRLIHAGGVHTQGFRDGLELLPGAFRVEFHDDGQHHRAGDAVRRVIDGAQRMGHGVRDAQTDVGIGHGGHILGQRHALPAFGIIGNGLAQVRADVLDGFQIQAVGQLPGRGGGIALNGVGQGVHPGGGGEPLGHGGHHIGIHDGHVGNIVRVHADELPLLLHISDHVVDRGLGAGAAGGGHGDGENSAVLRGRDTLEGADIGELRVVDHDADSLAGIHGGTAADGDHEIRAGFLIGPDAVLDVFNGGIGLDIGIQGIGDPGLIQQIGHLFGDAELDQIRIGGDEGLFEAMGRDDSRNLLNRAVSMIGHAVQNKTID